MTDDEIIAVVQAHKEGKKIEERCHSSSSWRHVTFPRWNFEDCDYRVKKEPSVIYANEYGSKVIAYKTKFDAESSVDKKKVIRIAVKYKEVVEDEA